MNIIDFLIEKTANSERWEGRSVFEKKNKSYKNSLLEHLFFSYRLGQILGLEEKYCLALLFHDLCEIKYGDVSVGKVNQCTNKIVNKIANIAENNNEKTKEKLEAIIYNSENKNLSDIYKVFSGKIKSKQKTKIEIYLKEIGILKSDNTIISVKKIKSQQDKTGELYIFNLILGYVQRSHINLIQEAINLMEHPLVKFVEKAETSFTMISKDKSNYVKKNKDANWLEYSLREYNNIKKCKKSRVLLKSCVLLKVFLLQQYLIDSNKLSVNAHFTKQENDILGLNGNTIISLKNINEILLRNETFDTNMKAFLKEREKGEYYAIEQIRPILKEYFISKKCSIDKQKDCPGVFDELYNKVNNSKELSYEYSQTLRSTPKVDIHNRNFDKINLTKIGAVKQDKIKIDNKKEKIGSRYYSVSKTQGHSNSL